MKNKYFISTILCLALMVVFSCKKDDVFAPQLAANSSILFQVADGVLTGTTLVGVIQPSLDVANARFSKVGVANPANYVAGNVVITAVTSSEVTSIVVNVLSTASVVPATVPPTITTVREQKGPALSGSGSFVFTYPIATLGLGGTTPANNATLILEFVATNSNGTTTVRIFSVQVIA